MPTDALEFLSRQIELVHQEQLVLRNELSLLRSKVQELEVSMVSSRRLERPQSVSSSLFKWTVGGVLAVVTALIALLGEKLK